MSASLPQALKTYELIRHIRKRVILALYISALLFPLLVHAEGSKDLNLFGGYRAFLNSTSNIQNAAPFPTPGTMKVYVRVGETIYVGSSAQGTGNGTINMRAPSGALYTSGNSTIIGRILSRTQEMAGPLPNTNGYIPYTHTVAADEEGVWEIDFVAPNAASTANPTATLTSANWNQGSSFWICAFDVSVRNTANNAWIPGRVFTNIFCGNMGDFDTGFNGVFTILTKDGYVYSVDNNGMAGFNFQFFVNNKGFRDPATGTATYKSLNSVTATPPVQDPRVPDSGSDITHKIFFTTPASDLPASAASPSGVVWLLNTPITPTVSTYTFTGLEGSSALGGTNPMGGFISYASNQNGQYAITIDVNHDGDYTDPEDRTLTGNSSNGTNNVYWDGLDGTGAKAPASIYSIPIKVSNVLFGGEVHFPFFDVESNPNGIRITRLNGSGSPSDGVYWNDSNIVNPGTPPNPLAPDTAESSNTNGHIWSNDFGNEKGMDTWAYVLSAPQTSNLTFALREADLEVVDISSSSPALCTGQTVTFTTRVRNNGPTNISGASYRFSFPVELSGVTVGSSNSGTALISNSALNSSQYTANLAMDSGSVLTYTFTGTVAGVPASGQMALFSGVMRAADYSDPDATQPDAAAPSDMQIECDAAPSGTGCNNIKNNSYTVTVSPTTANAGADQAICGGNSATLAGNTATSGTGTWSVVSATSGTPVFTNANSPSTNVSGLTTGTYVFRWSIATGGGCTPSTDDVQVTIQAVVSNNTLTNPTTVNFCGPTDPVAVVGSTATGGNGTINYQWQSSTDNVTYTDVVGATSRDYDPPLLNAAIFYRRQVTSGVCTTPLTSNVVAFSIQPALANNSVTAPGTTTFCTSGDPDNIPGSTPTGGTGTYVYQWQSSSDNVSFSNITAANAASYNPPSTSSTIYFRRQVTSGACTTPSNSNTVTITILPTLSAGIVATSQVFCVSGNPNQFTELTAASGGNGSYTYQWESSTTSATTGFTDVVGATSTTYDAPALSQTTYYRRATTSSVCADAISNTLTVTIYPAVTAGVMAASQSFCNSGDPAAFTETTAAGGGDGSYTYQWQGSTDNVSFSNIVGATATVYDVSGQTSNSYYRRVVTSSTCPSATGNTLSVLITPSIGNNSIGSDQTVCSSTTPAALTGSTPTGGSGGYAYVWESSTTGPTGFATATGINSNINYAPGNLAQTTSFRRRVGSGACVNDYSNTITITVNSSPTTANAGGDQGPMNATFATLNGNTATVGVGTWTFISGPNTPTIQNPNLSNTNITGLIPGTYTLRWTIASSPCTPTTDDVQIRINIAPVATNDARTFAEDTPVTLALSSNDSDADGTLDLTSIFIVSLPGHGTLTINTNGTVLYTPNANYFGTDSFTYTINDNSGSSSNTATVNLTITPVNDAPDAQNDQVNTSEDVPVVQSAPGVLANDTDADLDPLTVQLLTGVNHGSLTFNANGSWSYTPALDYTGFDGFTYRACDGTTCDTAVVTIVVGNVNDVPDCTDDSYSVAEDNVLNITGQGFLTNDTDNDGDVLSATLISTVSHGQLIFRNTGSFTYTPAANYFGPDQFFYRACDGSGACDSAYVNITVTPVNDKPQASNLSYSVSEDGVLTVVTANGVLSAVTDIDGTSFTASIFSNVSRGSLSVNANGAFVYTPNADFNGVDEFVYQACDLGNPVLCDTARVTITITPVNDTPVAVADVQTINEDVVLSLNNPGLLINDTDRDNDPLTAAIVTGPTHGTAVLNANGRLVYTPNANYNGTDQFTYSACDPSLACSTTTMTITIVKVNDAPIAGNDSYSVQEDNTLTVGFVLGVLRNDIDPDTTALTAAVLAGPANGNLVLNANGSFTYVPNANFNGTDQFTYAACDGQNLCDTATVSIQVSAVNDKPVAVDNTYSVNEDAVLTVNAAAGVRQNDVDPDNDPLTVAGISQPTNGTVSVNPDGSFVYTPNANYNGTDQFDYRVCDNVSLCDTATVFLTIVAVNDTPTVGNLSYTFIEDQILNVVAASGALSNSSDIDGNTLNASIASGPAHGNVTLNANGSFSFTPTLNYNGTDQFRVNVCDPFGACRIATINLTITPVNDPPIPVDGAYTVNEDAVLTRANPGVLTGVTDPDNDPMTVAVSVQPKHGSVTMNAAGGFTYTPNADYNGPDSLIFQVCDNNSACAFGTSRFTVVPVNDPPRPAAESFVVAEDNVLTVGATGVLFNDSDPEGNALSSSLFTNAAHGNAAVSANGSFIYTPVANYFGQDTFVYVVCDNATPSLCATQAVAITVAPVNDPPVAVNNSYTLSEDVPLTTVIATGLLSNDTDPENDALIASRSIDPLHGTVVINTNGTFTYTPDPDYTGTDRFVYQVCDATLCDTGTVFLTITPVNDPPRPQDDNYSTSEDVSLVLPASGGVLFNDSDPEGNTMTATLETAPLHGTALLSANGALIYIPTTNFVGIDSLIYRVTDNFGAFALEVVRIVVVPVNDNPTALDDNYSVVEDNILSVSANGLLGNDSDIDGDIPSVVSVVTAPLHGTAILNANGSFTFTPVLNYSGPDSFTYRIQDGNGGFDTATVTITITPVNDPPIANGTTYTLNEDTPFSQTAPGLMFSDSDPDQDVITMTGIAVFPLHGSIVANTDGSFLYTPATNFTGLDSLTYQISDGRGGTATGVAHFIIRPVNDRPVAVDDSYSTAEDVALNVAVGAGAVSNDTDIDGDVLTVSSILRQPVHGSVTVNANGSFLYTPTANFNGIDSIIYVVSDGNGGVDTATIHLTITPVNDPPLARNDNYNVTINTAFNLGASGVMVNDQEFDGEALTVTPIVSQTGVWNGTLTVNANGSLNYVPFPNLSYVETFQYILFDASGNSDTALIIMNVGDGNDTPVARNDSNSIGEDSLLTVVAAGILTNDFDPDDTSGVSFLNAALVTGPIHGTLTLNADGSFSYQPDANYFGTDSFVYAAVDGNGADSNATVSLTITPVNDPPVAVNDARTINEDANITFNILSNDTDPDNAINASTVDLVPGTPARDTTLTISGQGTFTVDASGNLSFVPVLNFNGAVTPIRYSVVDASGDTSNQAIVTITVTAVNDVPVALGEGYTMIEDGFLVVSATGVLGNDSDIDGNAITSVLSQTSSGTLTFGSNGSFDYHPVANFTGTDFFTYQACDATGCSAPATVIITITPVNDAPSAANDQISTFEGTPITSSVAGNDFDVDLDPLTFTQTANASHGSVVFNSNGNFTYTPDALYFGADQFSYSACDAALCATAFVNITVRSVNNPPIPFPDSYTTNEDVDLVVDRQNGVLKNDIDPDDELIVSVVTTPIHGALILNSNGSFRYTPNLNYFGTDSFIYEACDSSSACAQTTVSITINTINDRPVANDEAYTIVEDSPATSVSFATLLSNDSDVESGVLTVTLLGTFNHGTTVIGASGYTYTVTPNYTGTDTLRYQVCDAQGACDTAVIRYTITPVNDPPVASNETYNLAEDSPITVAIPGVLSNDSDPDLDALRSTIVTGPKHGVINLSLQGGFDYTPATDFYGTDSVVYQVCDLAPSCVMATAYFIISSVNDAPTAVADNYTTIEDRSLTVDPTGVMFNDFDRDGNAISVSLVSTTSSGVLSFNTNGGFLYVPAANFNGVDQFVYRLCDNFSPAACVNQTVTITVTPVNDVPVANRDTLNPVEDQVFTIVAPGLLANDTDADGDVLTATVSVQPAHGTLALNTNGSLSYTPVANYFGPDQFIYQICDPLIACDTAIVILNIRSVPDNPIAVNDFFTILEDSALTIPAVGVMFNDSDVDSDSLVVSVLSGPSSGSVILSTAGALRYVPDANFNGNDTLYYLLSDLTGGLDTGMVVITVTAVNDNPNANPDFYSTNEDVPLNVAARGVLINDTDVDPDVLTVNTVVVQPTHGSLNMNANGSFSYIPLPQYFGSDQFIYRLSDGRGGTDTVSVYITVVSVNDASLAVADTFEFNEDETYSSLAPGVMFNDSDPDGDLISASISVLPINGNLVFNANGSFTYTPQSNYTGTDNFTYIASDGRGGLTSAVAHLIIRPLNDAPVAITDNYSTNEDVTLNVAVKGILANDVDVDGDSLLVAFMSTFPAHGTLTQNANGSFSYVPVPDYFGSDSYIYTLSDGNGGLSAATVHLTVVAVDDLPVARNDLYFIPQSSTLVIGSPGVLFNDQDNDGGTLSCVSQLSKPTPEGGVITLDPNGSFTYVSDPGRDYNDTILYTINDPQGNSATARIIIVVGVANHAPVAADDFYNTTEEVTLTVSALGVLVNDQDVDDGNRPDNLAAILLTPPTKGTLSLALNGGFVYVPAHDSSGNDSFTYRAMDANGADDTATVFISITGVNDAPVAIADAGSGNEDTPVSLSILSNDFDVDGQLDSTTIDLNPLSPFTRELSRTIAGEGTFTLNAGVVTFTPVANFHGTSSISYTVKDGPAGLTSNSANITVTIFNVNDVPVALADTFSVNEDAFLVVNQSNGILINDFDPDGEAIVSMLSSPSNGTVVLNADGSFVYRPVANFNGVDSLRYRACDIHLACSAPATVRINILPVNDPPVAGNDTLSTLENDPVTGNVATNDYDIDSPTLTFSLNSSPLHGSLTFNADGTFNYTPNLNYSGQDQFTYSACDGAPLCTPAVVNINVIYVNRPPVANPDYYTILEDSTLSRDAATGIALNDVDPDGQMRFTLVSYPVRGNVSIRQDGAFMYVPDVNFSGTDRFIYRACDIFNACDTAMVYITVGTLNDAPIARTDFFTVREDSLFTYPAVKFLVDSNDFDIDGDPMSFTFMGSPKHGTNTTVNGVTYTYRPAANFNGIDTIMYRICDPYGLCDTGYVRITVTPKNDAPVAANNTYSTPEDTKLTVSAPGVLGNDVDVDGDQLVATLISSTNGQLVFYPDGSFTYTPLPGFFGTDSFIYRACDISGLCSTAQVSILVNSVNDAPTAVNDTVQILANFVASGNVLINDSDPEQQVLTASAIGLPVNGSLLLKTNGKFSYTPNPGFSGVDQFTYRICDNGVPTMCDTATVTIIVKPVAAVNLPPLAINDNYTTNQNTPLVITTPGVIANDVDEQKPLLSSTLVEAAENGSLNLSLNGSFTYIPNNNFAGADSFSYQVCDTARLCDTAWVFITVQSVQSPNRAPIALNDTFNLGINDTLWVVTPGVLYNDSEPDGQPLTLTLLQGTVNGTLTGPGQDGSFKYVPAYDYLGMDSLVYQICDNGTPSLCDTAVVYINMINTNINLPPVAVDDTLLLNEDASVMFTGNDLLNNDYDPENGPLTYTILSQTSHGLLALSGGIFTYTPVANYNGPDGFSYQLCDDHGLCDTAFVLITVIPVNDPPVAIDDAYTTKQDSAITIVRPAVILNDSDIDGDSLQATIIGSPVNGTMVVNANQSLTYTPNAGFFGKDSVLYAACDGGGLCDTAMIRVNVIQVITNTNRPPQPQDDDYQMSVNKVLTILAPGILSNDSDPDGDPLTASRLTSPAFGTLFLDANGGFAYTPNTNFIGVDSFLYNACDNKQSCVSKKVTITVIGHSSIGVAKEMDPPVLQADGSYLLNFTFRVKNYGDVPLTNVQLTDNLTATFPAPLTYTLLGAPVTSGSLVANTAFDGSSDANLLAGAAGLAVNEVQQVTFALKLNLNGGTGPWTNFAIGSATSVAGSVTDFSTNGTDPDPDGNGDPSDNSTGTPIIINEYPGLGIAKAVSAPVRNLDGSFKFNYTFIVRNFGNTALTNVQVRDDLDKAFPYPATYSVLGVNATGTLVANSGFNGADVKDLLVNGSLLAIGRTDTIVLSMQVLPDANSDIYFNTATATGKLGPLLLSDESVNGLNPDPDGDGSPIEAETTPVTLRAGGLFIPGGFSPDGDGINDHFVIENYGDQKINLEMYNRWGNVVFAQRDYKNDWDGKCNTGIYVGENLPDGTYYYVVKLSGGDHFVGFITINR